jgi:hypothetical protein
MTRGRLLRLREPAHRRALPASERSMWGAWRTLEGEAIAAVFFDSGSAPTVTLHRVLQAMDSKRVACEEVVDGRQRRLGHRLIYWGKSRFCRSSRGRPWRTSPRGGPLCLLFLQIGCGRRSN